MAEGVRVELTRRLSSLLFKSSAVTNRLAPPLMAESIGIEPMHV
jgi:hypothetical protein